MFCTQEEYRSLNEAVPGGVLRCSACGALHPSRYDASHCCPVDWHAELPITRRTVVQHGLCRVETLVPYNMFVDWELREGYSLPKHECIGHTPANNEAGEVWLESHLG